MRLIPEQHFTQPPPRYTEATLVKFLEERGIGRPSTYAPILSTIQDRGYVERDGRRLKPTELGMLVNDVLVQQFEDIMDPDFTANLEDKLDEVAQGERAWVPVVQEFYEPLNRDLVRANAEVERMKPAEVPTDEVCSEGHPMVIKEGRFGRFLACSELPRAQRDQAAARGAAQRRTRRAVQPRRADAAAHGALRAVLHVHARLRRDQAIRSARRRQVPDRRRRNPRKTLEERPHVLRLRELAQLRLGLVQSTDARAVSRVRRRTGGPRPWTGALPEARGRAAAVRGARAGQRRMVERRPTRRTNGKTVEERQDVRPETVASAASTASRRPRG